MDRIQLLLQRLDEIGQSLEKTGDARALLALGSVGVETERLDQYSDLDFFVIAKEGKKRRFLDRLDWLTNIGEAGFYFLNTPDGYKFLYKDGIYCEFAIFEEQELKVATYAAGRFTWKEADFDEAQFVPKSNREPRKPTSLEWAFHEALTCVYVGLCRYARGEKLSAFKFVQNYAVDLIVSATSHFEEEGKAFKDAFQHERRFENRYPVTALSLNKMIQGYEKTPESALEVLRFIEEKMVVNTFLKESIETLAEEVMRINH